MKKFRYTAYNMEHKKFSGYYFANNEEHLRAQLQEQDLFLVKSKLVQERALDWLGAVGKVNMKEVTYFCRQLAIMINSSIELVNCLNTLRVQNFSKQFKRILTAIYEDVKSGLLLSEAMQKHKKTFPEFLRNMVYVGEMSSSLEKVLQNIAEYYENEMRTKAKIKSALAYPLVLLVMMVGILVLMMVLVVPTFRASLGEFDIEMPALTMAIFDLSDFVLKNWLFLFVGLVVFVVLLRLLAKTRSGKMFFDTLAMNLTLTKKYQIAKTTSVFARSFGLLLASGMHIVEAMEVVQKVLGNKYIEKKFIVAIEEVRRGVSLTLALENMRVFPPMLLQMVAVGEKTASLDETLLKTCTYFDDQHQNALNAIMSLVQPMLMLIMGVTIGLMFVAIYSPMLAIMQGL